MAKSDQGPRKAKSGCIVGRVVEGGDCAISSRDAQFAVMIEPSFEFTKGAGAHHSMRCIVEGFVVELMGFQPDKAVRLDFLKKSGELGA